jgi:hypothetical protein
VEIAIRKEFIVAIGLVALLIPIRAKAHGTVGDYTFLEPLVAEDANPKNEFDIVAPSWHRTSDGREFSIGSSLEKKLSENFSITAATAWDANSPNDGRPVEGFENLKLLAKYAFLTIPEHEFRLSAAVGLEIPVGNPSTGASTHFRMGPELLWAKGLGDLPDLPWLMWLRPLGLQGDVGYSANTSGRAIHELFADEVIEYSFPYLNNAVRDVGMKWPLRNLYPFVEFNYDQLLAGPAGSTFPDVRITPGIAYVDHYIEISIGTQFPLNSATSPSNHAAVLGLLDLFIDDILPAVNWTPF